VSQLPLIDGVTKYIKENNVSFNMPGHKGGRGFLCTKVGEELIKNFISYDITEVEGVDNLHSPEGIIKNAQNLLRDLYGSSRSYFLVNGSTSGNLTMIFSSFQEGDKVLVERNCHKSIINGIIMRKLKPIYIKNKVHTSYNAPLSIDEEHFASLLDDNLDAKGVILTYPNYYGICFDINKLTIAAKEKGLRVLIDSAHGAHFGFSKGLPESAIGERVDMSVMSAHKTLPSLTQTAFLHISSKLRQLSDVDYEKTEFYLRSFLSTSPSYMFMCSMDYARYYLENYGNKAYEELIDLSLKYMILINELPGLHIISHQDIKGWAYNLDRTRYVINLKGGNTKELFEYLRINKITAEMRDNSNIVLILSPFNKEEDLLILYKTLKDYIKVATKEETFKVELNHIPQMEILPYEAFDMKKFYIELKGSLGRICGKAVIPYPPGVPIIMPGEIIDMETLEVIEYYLKNNISLNGMEDTKISVIIS